MQSVLVVLCAVVLGCLANQLPADEKAHLKQIHESCQANPKTFVDEDLLRKLQDNVNHKQVGVHMLCMSVKEGLQKPDGEFDLKTIKNKIALVLDDKSQADGFVKKCAVKKESPEKTAILLVLCLVQNNIPYYHRL